MLEPGRCPSHPNNAPEIARLRAHADFVPAARRAAGAMMASYKGNALMNRLMNDRGRFMLSVLMLSQYYEADPRGLTSSRLKDEAVAMDLCSRGRASAILGTFRVFGLLESVPAADRRLKRLAPSPKLIDMHRIRWIEVFEAIALVLPEGRIGVEHIGDERFLAAYVLAFTAAFRTGWRLFDEVPELAPFGDRDAGMMIAFSLLGTGFGEPPPPIAHLARSFGVSRSHVLAVLKAGVDAGLVHRVDSRVGPVAEPELIECLLQLLAVAFIQHAAALRSAAAQIEGTQIAAPEAAAHEPTTA